MVSENDVLRMARLSRLEINGEDMPEVTNKINSVLNYVEALLSADVESVEPLNHVHEISNVFRDDVVEPGGNQSELLKNAPEQRDNFFRVPLVITE
ncbi:MAG: Asp-tRNA(Asn)/Glu-tRNA(Gln) amidotransferase subunit GatC [Bdellovibrionales bacterium]|nr:Asp-tRNA(Asn)/Glu-tRNA(Gln) amidotransferase subunit GatC [Bdellovibrionales bacterium]